MMYRYSDDVGATACFLLSPLARAVTGITMYVDNGLNCMGRFKYMYIYPIKLKYKLYIYIHIYHCFVLYIIYILV